VAGLHQDPLEELIALLQPLAGLKWREREKWGGREGKGNDPTFEVQ